MYLRWKSKPFLDGIRSPNRYGTDPTADPATRSAASKFEFDTANGAVPCTAGQWFTVLQYRRARDNMLCNILLVDSEGTGGKRAAGSQFDSKLLFISQMEANIVLLRPTGLRGTSEQDRFLFDHKYLASKAMAHLPVNVQTQAHNVEYMMLLKVRAISTVSLGGYSSTIEDRLLQRPWC